MIWICCTRFGKGNGRTLRLFITLLVRNTGREIFFDRCNADLLTIAPIQAAQGSKDLLWQVFYELIKGAWIVTLFQKSILPSTALSLTAESAGFFIFRTQYNDHNSTTISEHCFWVSNLHRNQREAARHPLSFLPFIPKQIIIGIVGIFLRARTKEYGFIPSFVPVDISVIIYWCTN